MQCYDGKKQFHFDEGCLERLGPIIAKILNHVIDSQSDAADVIHRSKCLLGKLIKKLDLQTQEQIQEHCTEHLSAIKQLDQQLQDGDEFGR